MRQLFSFSLLLGLWSSFAIAQDYDSGTSRMNTPTSSYTNGQQLGWAGYLGVNAGYTGHNNDLSVEGTPASFKALGSYVTPETSGVFDLGYGTQRQTFTQSSAANSEASAGVMELAARYQFESRWQLGVVYNQFFNGGSDYGANQADAEFTGLQIMREFTFGDNILGRIGARAMTSINVSREPVNMALLDFQMGWGGTTRSTSTAASY